MAKRQKEWARRKREEMLEELGGKCVNCGATESLEFDCIVPRGDTHHRYDMSHRMSFYRKEHREGDLQILCKSCNAAKGQRELQAVLAVEEPY